MCFDCNFKPSLQIFFLGPLKLCLAHISSSVFFYTELMQVLIVRGTIECGCEVVISTPSFYINVLLLRFTFYCYCADVAYYSVNVPKFRSIID